MEYVPIHGQHAMTELKDRTTDQYQLQPEAALHTPDVTQEAPHTQTESMLREVLETVILALVLFLVIRQVVQNYRIESHSMEPNFYEGQFVLVNKLAYKIGEPNRGEVAVFHNPNNVGNGALRNTWCFVTGLVGQGCPIIPGEDYIKRVIGLPGDTVEVVGDSILINGQELPQPFVHNLNPEGTYFGPLVVPDGTIFVMGDNRPRSSDSRAIGPIDEQLLVGKAWLRVWPLNEFGLVQHYDLAPGQVVEVDN